MKHTLIVCSLVSILFISSNLPNIIYSRDGIEVYGVSETNEFQKASLDSARLIYNNSGSKYSINYTIRNYELKADSKNNLTGLCANSKDGQHIHTIIDNKPYTALYKAEHSFDIDSLPHLMLSFLSRSHHQSIKHNNAFKLTAINPQINKTILNITKPYLFYSRPKGTYVDNDANQILLDFYLVNTSISPKGNKVKVTIDSAHIFYIKEWKPYLIKGLVMGEHTVSLDLVDNKLRTIKTPFLPVKRNFILQKTP